MQWDWIHAVALLGAVAAVASSWMQGMIRLRILAVAANAFQFLFGLLTLSPITILQHGAILPVNMARLREMLRLVNNVKAAAAGDLSMDWLKPFMKSHDHAAGEIIFRKGDTADRLYVVAGGRYRLIESGIEIPPGEMVGELALLTDDNARTQGLECVEAGALLSASYTQIRELYFENPEFGFFFLKLVSKRLLANIATLEAKLAERALT